MGAAIRPNELSWVRAANRLLERAWDSGIAPRPVLEPAPLEAAALRAEGESAPLNEGPWRQRFGLLLADLASDAALNPLGKAMCQGYLVRLLRQRLRARRLWNCRPEIARRSIRVPIVIVGQMRSGTTRLHRLLACDRRLAHTRLFETLQPVRGGGLDLRRLAAWRDHRLLTTLNPALKAIHPVGPLQAEEEYGLHAFSFHGAQFGAQWRLPRFAALSDDPPGADVYPEFAMLLRTIGWGRGEEANKPWLLKAPQFLTDLPALLAEFPDARLILLERETHSVVASSASLIWNHRRIQSDVDQRHEIGREWLARTAKRQRALDSFLTARPEVRRITLGYDEVGPGWRGAVRRVYDFLGLALLPSVEARMARYLARASAHRGHHYALEGFGLDRARFDAAFADQRKL